nr:hypothetical protein C25H3.5 - Caenorhabditis elegans [Caenorhabditis elegans]
MSDHAHLMHHLNFHNILANKNDHGNISTYLQPIDEERPIFMERREASAFGDIIGELKGKGLGGRMRLVTMTNSSFPEPQTSKIEIFPASVHFRRIALKFIGSVKRMIRKSKFRKLDSHSILIIVLTTQEEFRKKNNKKGIGSYCHASLTHFIYSFMFFW